MKSALTLSALAVSFGVLCHADAVYNVSLNTASLAGNSSAPFAVDFQLTSGKTPSAVVNNATLSNFSLGTGGSAGTGSPFPNSGNASGSLSSTVLLSTSGGSFFNEFSQFFIPGPILTFQLDLTNNPQSGGAPDEFSFQLIDKTGHGLTTTDPSGSNSLFLIDLTGSPLTPLIFTANAEGFTTTPAIVQSTPEPSTASFLLLAGALLVFSGSKLFRHTPG